MIYRRGKKGTYWMRFRFAGRFVRESTKTSNKTLAREAERQRRHELAETFNGVQKRTLPPTMSRASKLADILGWSASTAIRMAKRYGHIRPEAQRQALAGVATEEIRAGVNQFVHQMPRGLESRLPN